MSTIIQNELTHYAEQYKCIAISTGHLSPDDLGRLHRIVSAGNCNMVMERDTGFFVKLYGVNVDVPEHFLGMSDHFNDLLRQVALAGYLLVEFDCDAQVYSCLPVFSHD
jgi:hypothetical protein